MSSKVYFVGLFVVLNINCVLSTSELTPLQQCDDHSVNVSDLRERIVVEPCGKKLCKLLRGSNTTVTITFKPEEEVKTLVSEVYADIQGIKFPFVMVTWADACNYVIRADTGDQVSCPLAANEEYIYKYTFPIEDFYPPISTHVHWSLNSGNKVVICFVLPAVIK